jgi:DNA-binding transcriptional LysR family regulator
MRAGPAPASHLPLDPRLLEPFAVLAEDLHFTRAAERMFIAQPALSQQIRRLENQVGTELFTRPPLPVELTPAGHALLAHARPALAEIKAGFNDAREAAVGRHGTVAVAGISPLSSHVIPALASAFRDEHPDTTLRVREASIEEQVDALHARTVDVGLFVLPAEIDLDRLQVDVLASGPSYVAVPPRHRLSGAAVASLEEFAAETWIAPAGSDSGAYRASFLASCRRHGFAPRIDQQANSVEMALGFVAAGFGVAAASWAAVLRPRSDVAFVAIADEAVEIVAARAGDAAPVTDAFVATARAAVAELVPVHLHAELRLVNR